MGSYFRQDFLDSTDGASLYFQLHGEGQPSVVLCDGLGCDGFVWKYLIPQLSQSHRVLRWHYRGHGRSTIPADKDRLGMGYTCEDLLQILNATGIEKAVIFGHSMGVQVALEFHRRHPERVLGLVLMCGSYGNPLDTFHNNTLLRSAFPYIRRTVERFPHLSHAFIRLLLSTPVALEVALSFEVNRRLLKRADLIPYFDHLSNMDPVMFVRTLYSIAQHSAWAHLPRVNVPTLVIAGEHDTFTPMWLSRKMAAALSHSDLVVIPSGSHTAPLEQPDLVWRTVQLFLQSKIIKTPAKRTRRQRAARSSG